MIPPAPAVHARDLPPLRLLLGSIRNSLAIWSDDAFDTSFSRNTLFGVTGEPVRRGTQVYVAPWVLHRHRKHWQHPTAFMPDRFAGQSSPWTSGGAFLPFGAGPRICIGAVFALAEAQIMLATVLQRHTLSIETPRPVMPVARLTIQPSHAPIFKLERTPSL